MSTSAFEGWAIVELFGHRRVAGRVSETEIAGAKLLRIDVPGDGADDFCTQFIGGAAIYCLTPTGEKEARAVAAASRPAPVTRFELPEPKARATCKHGQPENRNCELCIEEEDASDEEDEPIGGGMEAQPDGTTHCEPGPTAAELRADSVHRIYECAKCSQPNDLLSRHTCHPRDHDLVCKTTRGCYLAPGHAGDCDTAPF